MLYWYSLDMLEALSNLKPIKYHIICFHGDIRKNSNTLLVGKKKKKIKIGFSAVAMGLTLFWVITINRCPAE